MKDARNRIAASGVALVLAFTFAWPAVAAPPAPDSDRLRPPRESRKPGVIPIPTSPYPTNGAGEQTVPVRPAPALPGVARFAAAIAPGEWFEIPETSIEPVLISRAELRRIDPKHDIWQVQGPRSAINVWTGAAFDGRYWYFFGGGHNAYAGNELYRFDFATLEWRRLYDPAPLVSAVRPNGKSTLRPAWGPSSMHTYDSVVWSPKTGTLLMWATGDGKFSLWEWNPKIADPARAWSRGPTAPLAGEDYQKTALDPITGRIIVVGGGPTRASEYDPVTRTYARTSSGQSNWMTYSAGDIDPLRRRLYGLHKKGVMEVTLDGPQLGMPRLIPDTMRPPSVDVAAGFVYHPPSRTMVAWGGQGTVASFDPDTRTWLEFEGQGPKVIKSNGVYGKWIYLPRFDLFAGYNNTEQGVWLYRLPPPSQGRKPEARIEVCGPVQCRKFARLDRAVRALRNGDRLYVKPGTYRVQDLVVKADNVTLNLTGARFEMAGARVAKALWVIDGDDIVMTGGECAGVKSSSRNGACVRVQGKNFTARNVNWHDSENGLLTGKNCGSLRIETSRIHHNGRGGGGKSHNIYVGDCAALTIVKSQILCNYEGHGVKSGARATTIRDSRIDSQDCNGSRELDFYCGGRIRVENTVLRKGARSVQQDMVGIAKELRRCDKSADGTAIPYVGSGALFRNVTFESRRLGATIPISSSVPVTQDNVRYEGRARAAANRIR